MLAGVQGFEFAGKTVLITGASMGIGEVFARALARRGAALVLVARSEAKLVALAEELGNAQVIAADLSEPGAAQRVFDAVTGRGISVDVLINNAGFGMHGGFETIPLATQRGQIDVNVGALVELTHLFLPMIERRQGGVINVASMAGYQPIPYMAVYGATKAFVISFSEALWAEYRGRGVRVLALSPGATDTPFFARSGEAAAAGSKKVRPEGVVELGLAAFVAGRASVVHGRQNNVVRFVSRFLGREFIVKAAARMTRPKEEVVAGDRRG